MQTCNDVLSIQNIAFFHSVILVHCSFPIDCGVSLCGGQGHVPEVLHSYVVTATGPTPLRLHGSRGEHDSETEGEQCRHGNHDCRIVSHT